MIFIIFYFNIGINILFHVNWGSIIIILNTFNVNKNKSTDTICTFLGRYPSEIIFALLNTAKSSGIKSSSFIFSFVL